MNAPGIMIMGVWDYLTACKEAVICLLLHSIQLQIMNATTAASTDYSLQ